MQSLQELENEALARVEEAKAARYRPPYQVDPSCLSGDQSDEPSVDTLSKALASALATAKTDHSIWKARSHNPSSEVLEQFRLESERDILTQSKPFLEGVLREIETETKASGDDSRTYSNVGSGYRVSVERKDDQGSDFVLEYTTESGTYILPISGIKYSNNKYFTEILYGKPRSKVSSGFKDDTFIPPSVTSSSGANYFPL
ncbi:hypothetical protein V865_007806 [Kwoniella europaea PYCC6329]|uniref:Uncharacterized protein n=1 Tax=Kwoniella europaea PYCC6329 TaxID=1423913 RepID=A0AAX4KV75_9TREE